MRTRAKQVYAAFFLILVLCLTSVTAIAETKTGTFGDVKWSYDTSTGALSVTGSGATGSYSSKSGTPWSSFTTTGYTANAVIATAKAEVGYLEKKSASSLDSKTANAGEKNYTKYGRDMHSWVGSPYYDGNAWCDCFVDWCFVKTFGKDVAYKLLGGWSAYTPTSSNYFKKMDCWYTSPKVGDQIFFKNSTRIYHTGLVYKVTSSTVYTIEGNTYAGSDVVIENGGAVAYKSYSRSNSKIAGYGRPKYTSAAAAPVKKLTLGSGLTKIGNYAFSGLSSLSQVSIPSGTASIGSYAFADDSSIARVDIPVSVKEIAANAFSGCSALKDVYYDGDAASWKAISIGSGNTALTGARIHCAIADPLAITAQPKSVTVAADTLTKFTVETNRLDTSYQWQVSEDGGATWRDFTEKKTALTANLNFTITSDMDAWKLRCKTSADGKEVTSDVVSIEIQGNTMQFTSQPKSQTVTADELHAFAVETNIYAGTTYQWQVSTDGGKTFANFDSKKTAKTKKLNFTVTADMDGWMFRCIATNGTRTATSTPFKITIKAGLAITTQPKAQSAAAGSKAVFEVAVNQEGASYQWQVKDGTAYKDIEGATDASLEVTGTFAKDGSVYRCVVTSGESTKTSNDAALTVTGDLKVLSSPSDTQAEADALHPFTVKCNVMEDNAYQWQVSEDGGKTWRDFSEKKTATNVTLNFTVLESMHGWRMRCRITNGTKSVTTPEFSLYVNGKLSIVKQPENVTAIEGTEATFTTSASRSDAAYQWQVKGSSGNWSDISGAKASTYKAEAKNSENGNLYRCVVTAGGSTVTTDEASLTVKKGTLTFTSQPSDTTVKAGDQKKFVVETNPSEGTTYQWQVSKDQGKTWQDFTEKKTSTTYRLWFTLEPDMDGWQFRCKAANGTLEKTSDPFTVHVTTDLVIADQTGDVTTDASVQQKFLVTPSILTGTTYQWQVSTDGGKTFRDFTEKLTSVKRQLSCTILDSMDGWYLRCRVKNGSTEIFSKPIKITVNHKLAFTLQPENVETDPGVKVSFIIKTDPIDNVTYQWQVSEDNGKTWRDYTEKKTSVKRQLDATVTEDMDGWQFRCNATNGSVVKTSDTAVLKVRKTALAITAQPADVVCDINSIQSFTVGVSSTSGTTYQWQVSTDNGKTWRDYTEKQTSVRRSMNATVTEDMDGWLVRCAVTNSGKTIYSNAAKIALTDTVEIIAQPSDVTAFPGTKTTFLVRANRTTGTTYQWQVSTDGEKTWRDYTEKKTSVKRELSCTLEEKMDGWKLRCVVTNGTAKAISDPVTVSVKDSSIRIVSEPSDTTVRADKQVPFLIDAESEAELSYQWQVSEDKGRSWRDFTEKKTALTNKLYFTVTADMDEWQFRCKISNDWNTVTSSPFVVFVEVPEKVDNPVICIDPGHQAKSNQDTEPLGPGSSEMKAKCSSGTAGAATGIEESVLNLEVSQMLKTELESRGYKVIMTRTSQDVDLSNIDRANVANNANADLYLRIHADGSKDTTLSGCTTYVMTADSPYNADLYEDSYKAAKLVVDGIANATGCKNNGVHKSNSYTGINWSKVPVSIVEIGYMSNAEEDKLMATDAYRAKIVKGISDAVDQYFS